jgi:hypothetical protein
MVCFNDELLSGDNTLWHGLLNRVASGLKGGVRPIRTWIFVTFLFKAIDILAIAIRLDRSST